MVRVLVICSTGMSSTLIVETIKKELRKEEKEFEVLSTGINDFEEQMKSSQWNAVLLAPQVRHVFSDFEKIAKAHKTPIVVIGAKAYSPLGTKELMEQLNEMFKANGF